MSNSALTRVADRENRTLPRMINEEYQMTRAEVRERKEYEGHEYVSIVTVVNHTSSELNDAQFLHAINKRIRTNIRYDICEDQHPVNALNYEFLKELWKNHIPAYFDIVGNDGVSVEKLAITQLRC